ncbi:uncharacterized protein LOC119614166 [Lucilia sericata]|uniref:uncharacterized protein LOC119614166 n=1 Tax=Lucilia sericata TaxID=13632 RepID=UPI0018A8624D|nr:uncharacterized protein LOC119614166 [Lucilia sericata]
MVNNPFRSKPSTNVQQNVDDWGKTKFKPNKFGGGGGRGGKKPFNKSQGGRFGNNKPFRGGKFDNRKGNNHKNKDNYKFNQVARDAKPENATPWNKYKDEIVYKQREEEQAALQANMDTKDAKTALKQREMNYRKLLIEQKKQESTVWEDFGEEDEDNRKTKQKKHKNIVETSPDVALNEIKEEKGRKNFNKKQKKAENKLNSESKTKFKKNVSNSELKADVKEFISKELLDNFDSKKLSFKQNDTLRRNITKTTMLSFGNTLERTVKDMKQKKMKKKNQNKS